jgi:AraC-like DNA-binding protein
MIEYFSEHIYLDQLCRQTNLSKSTLLRTFTKSKGVTPYSYLQNIRIGEAKKLLEQGVPPVEAALQTGFSDQSHFTNYFNRFIGLSPGVYREIFSDKAEQEEAQKEDWKSDREKNQKDQMREQEKNQEEEQNGK